MRGCMCPCVCVVECVRVCQAKRAGTMANPLLDAARQHDTCLEQDGGGFPPPPPPSSSSSSSSSLSLSLSLSVLLFIKQKKTKGGVCVDGWVEPNNTNNNRQQRQFLF